MDENHRGRQLLPTQQTYGELQDAIGKAGCPVLAPTKPGHPIDNLEITKTPELSFCTDTMNSSSFGSLAHQLDEPPEKGAQLNADPDELVLRQYCPDLPAQLVKLSIDHGRPLLRRLCELITSGNSQQAVYCAHCALALTTALPFAAPDLAQLETALLAAVETYRSTAAGAVLATYCDVVRRDRVPIRLKKGESP